MVRRHPTQEDTKEAVGSGAEENARPTTNQEILEKAIRKAIDGGFSGYWADRYQSCKELEEMEYLIDGNNLEEGKSIETLIFNHDFARALWGEREFEAYGEDYEIWGKGDYTTGSGGPDESWYDGMIWEWHLQQMVIADDPIKYLGENLGG